MPAFFTEDRITLVQSRIAFLSHVDLVILPNPKLARILVQSQNWQGWHQIAYANSAVALT